MSIAQEELEVNKPTILQDIEDEDVARRVASRAGKPKTGRHVGFESLPEEERKRISANGGRRTQELGKAHRFDSEAAVEAQKKSVASRRANRVVGRMLKKLAEE
jgi:hypothetical protein